MNANNLNVEIERAPVGDIAHALLGIIMKIQSAGKLNTVTRADVVKIVNEFPGKLHAYVGEHHVGIMMDGQITGLPIRIAIVTGSTPDFN